MKRSFFIIIIVAVFIAIIVFLAGSSNQQGKAGKLKVAATIFPLYDIVRNVAGDRAEVKLIAPPGATPHFLDFSSKQLIDFQGVKIIFAIGEGLDDWVTQVKEAITGAEVVGVDGGIKLREFEDGSVDPHYWLNFGNARIMTDNIVRALYQIDPENKENYLANGESYKAALTTREQELKEMFDSTAKQPIITFHDAMFYFAEDFGLKIVGSFELAAGQEPTPRYLAELKKKVDEYKVKRIFIEPQMSSQVLAGFLKDNNLSVAELDEVGGISPRETYLKLMEFNASSILKTFKEK